MVDQGEVNVTWFVETDSQRSFIAFEYGAGDNSYGAVYLRTDGSRAASIHDGDLYDCVVTAQTCLLPDDYHVMVSDPAFRLDSDRVVTSAAGLAPALRARPRRRAALTATASCVAATRRTSTGSTRCCRRPGCRRRCTRRPR